MPLYEVGFTYVETSQGSVIVEAKNMEEAERVVEGVSGQELYERFPMDYMGAEVRQIGVLEELDEDSGKEPDFIA